MSAETNKSAVIGKVFKVSRTVGRQENMTKETYVKNIIKKLKCTNAKKKELTKQLEADITAELSGGESMEDIIGRMGSAESVAADFNENFSPEECKAAAKAKKIKITLLVLLIFAVIVAGVFWVLPKGSVEIKNFDEAQVKERVELVIDLLDAGDYEELEKYSIKAMQGETIRNAIENAKNAISSDWGKRVSFGNMYQAELTQMGATSIVTQVNVAYENISVTYQITLDKDLKLAGVYLK